MLREWQTKSLEVARTTLEYEARLLQLFKPDGLYVEGIPIRTDLENMMPIYLDEGSEAYYDLELGKNGSYLELQKRREEEDWATKISGSIWRFRKPLIIAGAAHLENEFGLVDLLSEKGIRLDVLNPRQQ